MQRCQKLCIPNNNYGDTRNNYRKKDLQKLEFQDKNYNDYSKYITVGTYEHTLHAMFPCHDIKDFILGMDASLYLFIKTNISQTTWHFYNSNARMVKVGRRLNWKNKFITNEVDEADTIKNTKIYFCTIAF